MIDAVSSTDEEAATSATTVEVTTIDRRRKRKPRNDRSTMIPLLRRGCCLSMLALLSSSEGPIASSFVVSPGGNRDLSVRSDPPSAIRIRRSSAATSTTAAGFALFAPRAIDGVTHGFGTSALRIRRGVRADRVQLMEVRSSSSSGGSEGSSDTSAATSSPRDGKDRASSDPTAVTNGEAGRAINGRTNGHGQSDHSKTPNGEPSSARGGVTVTNGSVETSHLPHASLSNEGVTNGVKDSGGDHLGDGGGITGSLSGYLREKVFLGIEPTPEILAIMTVYFVEGALGLARLAQTFLLKDQLHLGPAELSALSGLFTLPWTIKPLYGFLSDGYPLFGYRRRSYLVVAGILGALCYVALGADFWGLLGTAATGDGTVAAVTAAASSGGFFHVSVLQGTIAALVLSSACIACSDVVADGIVVERTRDSDDPRVAGGLQSLCWGSAALGGLISAYFSGSLLEIVGPREVFAITAALPLLVAGIALWIDEAPVGKEEEAVTVVEAKVESEPESASPDGGDVLDPATNGANGSTRVDPASSSSSSTVLTAVSTPAAPTPAPPPVREQIDALWSAVKQPAVWRPALFLFLWQSTPTSEGAFLYFMTNDLGMGPEFLGRVRLVTAAAGLVGVWAYQKFLRGVAIKDILFWTSIASTPLGLSQLLLITHANRAMGIPDGAFVFGDDVALAILGQLAFLPTLVLAARICPPGVEAVLFATLMSVFNGASTVGTEVGAALTKFLGVTESNFDNLALLTLICNVSSLYPLLFIGFLDEAGSRSEEEIEGKGLLQDESAAGGRILDVATVAHKGVFENDEER